MSEILGPAERPCGSCPYRKDVPSGVWHADEYAKLPKYDLPTPEQPMSLFLCHQQDGHVCAGWAGCHDTDELFALRLRQPELAPEERQKIHDYVSPVPLFESGQEAAEHGLAEYDAISSRALTLQRNLRRKGIVKEG